MEREGDDVPAPVVRMPNSVRISVMAVASEHQRARFSRIFVKKSILEFLFGIKVNQLFCFQNFSLKGFVDISFFDWATCQKVAAGWEQHKGHQLLGGLRLQLLCGHDNVPVTVHIYNPFVSDQDVAAFLRRHCKEVKGGTRVLDEEGTWTGKRRFLVSFRMVEGLPGEVVHPPATFAIGPHRGFLAYPGQPQKCWRCGVAGHTSVKCASSKCRFCGSGEHSSDRCLATKTCSLCGSADHLFRRCPSRAKSYAEAASEELEGAEESARDVGQRPQEASDSQLLAMRSQDGGGDLRPPRTEGEEVREGEVEPPGGEEVEQQQAADWGDSQDGAPEVSQQFFEGIGKAVCVTSQGTLVAGERAGEETATCAEAEMVEVRCPTKRQAAEEESISGEEAEGKKRRGQAPVEETAPLPLSSSESEDVGSVDRFGGVSEDSPSERSLPCGGEAEGGGVDEASRELIDVAGEVAILARGSGWSGEESGSSASVLEGAQRSEDTGEVLSEDLRREAQQGSLTDSSSDSAGSFEEVLSGSVSSELSLPDGGEAEAELGDIDDEVAGMVEGAGRDGEVVEEQQDEAEGASVPESGMSNLFSQQTGLEVKGPGGRGVGKKSALGVVRGPATPTGRGLRRLSKGRGVGGLK